MVEVVSKPRLGLIGISRVDAKRLILPAIGQKQVSLYEQKTVTDMLNDRRRPDLDILVVNWPLMQGHGSLLGLIQTVGSKVGIRLMLDAKELETEIDRSHRIVVEAKLTKSSTYEDLARMIGAAVYNGWPRNLCNEKLLPPAPQRPVWRGW